MKRIIMVLLFLSIFTCGCAKRVEVSREPIRKEFIAAHEESFETYVYIYTGKGLIPVPQRDYRKVDDSYAVTYLVKYDDGTYKEKTVNITKEEYDALKIKE